jgi:hypothetical protein
MAAKNREIRDRFIAKIRPFKRVEAVPRMSSVYTTFNEVLLDVRYSSLMDKDYYWFFIDTHRLNQWRGRQRFVECFICGDENTVVFVPDDKVFEWYERIEPNRKGHWFMKIVPDGDRLILKLGHGCPEMDAREYLNRFDLISPLIPRPIPQLPVTSASAQTAFEDVRKAILAEPELKGDSLHERVIDMLAYLGEWSGCKPRKSYATEPNSPYELDIVWMDGDEIDLAVEVHDGGNETEAKDRLRHALRFGARKVVVVSVPSAIGRLKSVCQFEADLKQWLEIWSVARVYKMYRSGREFFDDFRPFRKRQRSENVGEFL